jgi:hypothetical protein
MEPDKIIENLFGELAATLKAMSKTKSVEEKLRYSEIVKNLSESLGVFLHMADAFSAMDYEEE